MSGALTGAHRALAGAVVLVAIEDLKLARRPCTCAKRTDGGRCRACRDRDDAVRFFQSRWRSEFWLEAAGVDADETRVALRGQGLLPKEEPR